MLSLDQFWVQLIGVFRYARFKGLDNDMKYAWLRKPIYRSCQINLVSGVGTGNHGTSEISSPHDESSWRLNELREGVVTIEMGSLLEY